MNTLPTRHYIYLFDFYHDICTFNKKNPAPTIIEGCFFIKHAEKDMAALKYYFGTSKTFMIIITYKKRESSRSFQFFRKPLGLKNSPNRKNDK